MTAARPYRMTPLTREQALAELRKFAGIQFDPVVVDAFVQTHVGRRRPRPGPPRPSRARSRCSPRPRDRMTQAAARRRDRRRPTQA